MSLAVLGRWAFDVERWSFIRDWLRRQEVNLLPLIPGRAKREVRRAGQFVA